MRRHILKFTDLLLALIMCFFVFLFNTSAVEASFTTKNYEVNITVNLNKTYEITENITLNFTPNTQNHGFVRNIPLGDVNSSSSATLTKIKITGDQFTESDQDGIKTIKIGDPEKLVSGEKNYTLSYTYYPGFDPKNGYDSFYYNVIPSEWNSNIAKLSVVINMPKSFDGSKIQISSGSKGITRNIFNAKAAIEGNKITVKTVNGLKANNGITVLLPLSEGYFPKSANFDLGSYSPTLLVLVIGVLSITVFLFFKRKTKVTNQADTANMYPLEENMLKQNFCIDCGTKLDKDAKFCSSCGKSVLITVNETTAKQEKTQSFNVSVNDTSNTPEEMSPGIDPDEYNSEDPWDSESIRILNMLPKSNSIQLLLPTLLYLISLPFLFMGGIGTGTSAMTFFKESGNPAIPTNQAIGNVVILFIALAVFGIGAAFRWLAEKLVYEKAPLGRLISLILEGMAKGDREKIKKAALGISRKTTNPKEDSLAVIYALAIANETLTEYATTKEEGQIYANKAIPLFYQARDKGLDTALLRFCLAFLYKVTGQNKEAISYYKSYLKLRPKDEETRKMMEELKEGKKAI